jgi:hypothetical protein
MISCIQYKQPPTDFLSALLRIQGNQHKGSIVSSYRLDFEFDIFG